MNQYIQVREKTPQGVIMRYITAQVLRSRATLNEMINYGGRYIEVQRDEKLPGMPRYIEIETN